MFIMLIGSSGVGKNTLINSLKKQNRNVALMPTLTTRKKRPGERAGKPFYFLTKEEFQKKIKDGELLEHELIHGNYYGASKLIFNEYITKGKILMKDIGVEGAENLSYILKDKTNTIKVFLTTKNKKVLVKRLKQRGEKDFKKRLKRFRYEQKQKYKSDFIILNNDQDKTIALLKEILKNKNEIDNYVFTKPISKLNKKKVKALAEEYKVGFMPNSIKVTLQDGKIHILSGHEKFIASLMADVNICKEVKENKKIKALTQEQSDEWKAYIKSVEEDKKLEEKQKKEGK